VLWVVVVSFLLLLACLLLVWLFGVILLVYWV
jgi:hypothetical protein